jgi:hypothetical protein
LKTRPFYFVCHFGFDELILLVTFFCLPKRK